LAGIYRYTYATPDAPRAAAPATPAAPATATSATPAAQAEGATERDQHTMEAGGHAGTSGLLKGDVEVGSKLGTAERGRRGGT
jgi:hypothetical protein